VLGTPTAVTHLQGVDGTTGNRKKQKKCNRQEKSPSTSTRSNLWKLSEAPALAAARPGVQKLRTGLLQPSVHQPRETRYPEAQAEDAGGRSLLKITHDQSCSGKQCQQSHSSCKRAPSRLNTRVFQKPLLVLESTLCPDAFISGEVSVGQKASKHPRKRGVRFPPATRLSCCRH